MVKVAVAQMEPKLMKVAENLERILSMAREAAGNGASLIVFPECSLTGYIFLSREEALSFAESIPGPSTRRLIRLCEKIKAYVIFGLLEKEGDKLFNTAVMVGPPGLIAKYRKHHLPFLGVDRFTDTDHEPFHVYGTPIGNVGLQICYDVTFPETSRVMALLGADMIALPANFPRGRGERIITYVISARAIENRVHMVAANRVGNERGYQFAGLSKIVDASGEILGLGNTDKEEIIYAEINPESARQKHFTVVPGEWETDCIGDRHPELYWEIVKPKFRSKSSP